MLFFCCCFLLLLYWFILAIIGTSDHVSCFSCGSGLRNWEPEDDPWMEHARWFPQCRFLILMKGEEYIKEASESMPTSNFGASRSKSKAPPLPLMGSSRPSPSREVSEAELERTLLDSPIAQTVTNSLKHRL